MTESLCPESNPLFNNYLLSLQPESHSHHKLRAHSSNKSQSNYDRVIHLQSARSSTPAKADPPHQSLFIVRNNPWKFGGGKHNSRPLSEKNTCPQYFNSFYKRTGRLDFHHASQKSSLLGKKWISFSKKVCISCQTESYHCDQPKKYQKWNITKWCVTTTLPLALCWNDIINIYWFMAISLVLQIWMSWKSLLKLWIIYDAEKNILPVFCNYRVNFDPHDTGSDWLKEEFKAYFFYRKYFFKIYIMYTHRDMIILMWMVFLQLNCYFILLFFIFV